MHKIKSLTTFVLFKKLEWRQLVSGKGHCSLTLFWTGGKFAPPAGFFNIAQKPLGLGS